MRAAGAVPSAGPGAAEGSQASLPTPEQDDFARIVITWQAHEGRHHLPWQGGRDAYRIWLSEIMLQQTQVATVIPYYERFLARFPTLRDLAEAPLEDVLALWSGLGYYSRARNLHRCATEIMARHQGAFPSTPEALAALPGIGRSTAAAIAVFAFGRRAAILDGNVKRVLCRAFAIEGFPGERRVEQSLWDLAGRLLPAQGIEAYTQGLMDLGASICTRGRPACARCPLRDVCRARRLDRVGQLPTPRPRRIARHRVAALLLFRQGGRVLLARRPDRGIWGGLWSLPEVDLSELAPTGSATQADLTAVEEAARVTQAAADLRAAPSMGGAGLTLPTPVALAPFEHAFTHYTLRARPWLFELGAVRGRTLQGVWAGALPEGWRWWDADEWEAAALPRPIKTLLRDLPAA